MPDRKKNILVTGVGAVIGYGILNSLKKGKHDVSIVGMDIYPDAYGAHVADKFVQAVPAKSEGYARFIDETAMQYEIDLIIPGIEQDLYALHAIKENTKTKVVMNNDLCISLSRDKLKTFEFLISNKVPAIPTLHRQSYSECVKALGSPFLVKPRFGYASKGIHVIKSEEEFTFYAGDSDAVICQRIIGTIDEEYTVSVFGDGRGGFFDSIILQRKLSQEGATSKAILIEADQQIMSYTKSLCSLLRPVGPTNLQMRTEAPGPLLLEINPMIPPLLAASAQPWDTMSHRCVSSISFLANNPLLNGKRRPGLFDTLQITLVMSDFAVLADIHGNYPALASVLEDIDRRGVKTIYCLGDLVGYYCMINEVLDAIRARDITSTVGNHDFALLHTGGVISTSRTCTNILRKQLTYIVPGHVSFLSSLQDKISFIHNNKKYKGVHGGLVDPVQEYLTNPTYEYFEVNNFDSDVLLSGHTHLPQMNTYGRFQHLNPGSVGQPRDGDPRASYALFSSDGNAQIVRVAYDIDRIADAMKMMGFEKYIYEVLYRGVKIGQ